MPFINEGERTPFVEGGSRSLREGAVLEGRTPFIDKGGRMLFFKRGRTPFVEDKLDDVVGIWKEKQRWEIQSST